jgi:hypothetical protein
MDATRRYRQARRMSAQGGAPQQSGSGHLDQETRLKLGTALSTMEASAVVCARGVYRAGCVATGGAAVVGRPVGRAAVVAHPVARRGAVIRR